MKTTSKRHKFFTFISGFLAYVMVAVCANAASENSLCYLEDGSMNPEDRELGWHEHSPLRFRENYHGEYDAVWIARNKVSLWNCPKEIDGRPAQKLDTALNFGRRYFLSDRAVYFDKNGERWYLLSEQVEINSIKPVHAGWVKGSYLLKNRSPLINDRNNISYKALIHKSFIPGSLFVPLRFSPGTKVKIVGDVQIKQQFYIYDLFKQSNPNLTPREKREWLEEWSRQLNKSIKIHETEKQLQKDHLKDVYILLGDTPKLDVGINKLGKGLLGWVSAASVRLWNTREGLEFSGPVTVYKNTNLTTKTKAINQTIQYSHTTPRHPVFQTYQTPSGNLFRIGFFNRISPKIIKKKLNNITIPLDVLFVIDATRSMKPAFKDTKSAINEMVHSLNKSASNQLIPPPYFGLTIYRDKPGPTCAQIKEIEHPVPPQTWKANGLLERSLEKLKANDCDIDYEESLYKGLFEGVRNARFRKDSYRIVIHLGDDGDHGRNVTVEQVAEEFRKNRINYFPIFYNTPTAKKGATNHTFNQSVTTLSQIVGRTKDSKHYINITHTNIKNQIVEALQLASASQKKQQEEIRVLEKTLTKLSSKGIGGEGKWIDLKLDKNWNWENDLSPRLKEYIRKLGLSSKDFINIYHEGWVGQVMGDNQDIQTVVLVDYHKLLTLQTVLNSLIQSKPTPRELDRTWSRVLAQLTGDQPCDASEKLQVCLRQLSGVHFNLGILQYSLAELSKILETNQKKFAELLCEAKGKNAMISGILEEKDYQVSFGVDSGNCIVNSKHIAEKKYWFTAGDTRLAWIPLSKLP